MNNSVVILLALMPHGEEGDRARVFDLEQRHIAGIAEGNDHFAQQGIGRPATAVSQGLTFQRRLLLGLDQCAVTPIAGPALLVLVFVQRRIVGFPAKILSAGAALEHIRRPI